MGTEAIHQFVTNAIVGLFAGWLYPLMVLGFVVTVVMKLLVDYTVRRQWWFAKEFEKRVIRYADKVTNKKGKSFYQVCKRLLERTYYELFEVRGIMMRRKLDYVSSPIDRLFAIQHGCAWYVKDTLREIRHIKNKVENPPFLEISKTVNAGNPCFGKLFGWIPLGSLNELLSIAPGLFIISGIFGTFLGIMQGLPALGQLDIKDAEASKLIMDTFLVRVSFSIGASITGIAFSIFLSLLYAVLSSEKLYIKIVDVYDRCLTRVWETCEHNDVPDTMMDFDEHKDPIAALASLALDKEVSKGKHDNRFEYAESETERELGGEGNDKKAA